MATDWGSVSGPSPDLPGVGEVDGPRSPGELEVDVRPLGTWSVNRAGQMADVRHGATRVMGHAPPEVQDTLALVVSELATNALKYGSGAATVAVAEVARGWLVDVHDSNLREYPRQRRGGDGLQVGGQGLAVVEAVCPRWGWYVDSWTRRKHVWALLDPGLV